MAVYSGDGNNSIGPGSFGSEPETVTGKASPTITTTPSTTTGVCGTSETLKDTATLSGGDDPTGTITFTLYSPSGTLLDTETVTVSGDGTYTTPNGYTLPANAATGTYQWDASYSGDSNNNAASDNNDPNEQVVVALASPTISTTPSTTSALCGTTVTFKDTATLSGGDAPDRHDHVHVVQPERHVVGHRDRDDGQRRRHVHTPKGYTLPSNAAAGTYQWDASYSGDSNNNAATDNNDSCEQVVVDLACGQGPVRDPLVLVRLAGAVT